MPRYILKENHPAKKALKELSSKAYDLGIEIMFSNNRAILIYKNKEYLIEDLESQDSIDCFPFTFMEKLVIDTDICKGH